MNNYEEECPFNETLQIFRLIFEADKPFPFYQDNWLWQEYFLIENVSEAPLICPLQCYVITVDR